MLTTRDGQAGTSALARPQLERADHPATDAVAPNTLVRNERSNVGNRRISMQGREGYRAAETDYFIAIVDCNENNVVRGLQLREPPGNRRRGDGITELRQ